MSAANSPAAPGATRSSRNRFWLVVIGLTPIVFAAVATAVYLEGPSEPSVSLTPPSGYRAITDAYWAYAIPSGWTEDSAYTDSNGDFFYRGVGGWIGETLLIRSTAPTLYEKPPITLASFGQPQSTPYRLTGGAPTAVPGADAAFSYTLVRGNVSSRVVDAWIKGAHTEIWVLVEASRPVTDTIVSSLRA